MTVQPLATIPGGGCLKGYRILPNKREILTCDSAGNVALWSVLFVSGCGVLVEVGVSLMLCRCGEVDVSLMLCGCGEVDVSLMLYGCGDVDVSLMLCGCGEVGVSLMLCGCGDVDVSLMLCGCDEVGVSCPLLRPRS